MPQPRFAMDMRSNRDLLLSLLHEHGILYASDTQLVRSRDGTHARWMLDSLGISLTTDGLKLAGEALLELLDRFEGRQVATYGVTAITLLTAAIMQSDGKYNGLIVRPQRKPHGSSKLIEGRIDPDEPVIMLDDSVSSGTNMLACYESLKEAGLRVEGGVCLVRFGWYGGFARLQEKGLQMETVYDIWDDFMYRMPDEVEREDNPTKRFPKLNWGKRCLADGMHPAHVARKVMEQAVKGGKLPLPPHRLDTDYDTNGGAWVSVRQKGNIYLRHGRDGFWTFPEENPETAPMAIAMAAAKTAQKLPTGDAGLKVLNESSIAVTTFSALEPCSVGQLDNDRYGIVVRSRVRAGKMGGALPRMPGISTAWQQFQHARIKNGDLVSFEPYDLLRHDVSKAIEPNSEWQPTGVPQAEDAPWHQNSQYCGELALYAKSIALKLHDIEAKLPSLTCPKAVLDQIDTIFVSVYSNGQLLGCMGSKINDLAADLENLTTLAIGDDRFKAPQQPVTRDSLAVTVSILHTPLVLGDFSPEEVMQRIRLGQQALMVYQGSRSGLLLPHVAAQNSFSAKAFALEVIDKAGITRPPYRWLRYECATWLADEHNPPALLRGTEPIKPALDRLDDLLAEQSSLYSRYLQQHQRDNGKLYFRYLPLRNQLYQGGDLPRSAHGAWVLRRAGAQLHDPSLLIAGDRLLDTVTAHLIDVEGKHWLGDENTASIAELSLLVLALLDGPKPTRQNRDLALTIAVQLWKRIDRHGYISTHCKEVKNPDPYQDYFPGQMLLALAAASHHDPSLTNSDALDRAFRVYRHRFRHKRDFGAVSWLMQAFSRWHTLTGDPKYSDFVFEIGDWVLEYQQANGGFINSHQPDAPGYTSALYLEGLGAAVPIAEALNLDRAKKYRDACRIGLQFLNSLTIKDNMRSILPNPTYAIGGLRQSAYRDDVRIDFVQHALSAVLELHP